MIHGPLRVLVCGGRAFGDAAMLTRTLDELAQLHGISCIIHGGAAGADWLAGLWAQMRNVNTRVEYADWDAHGKAAGPIRNQKMLDQHHPDIVVAFPGGRGTADMVRRARRAGIPVMEIA